MSQNSRSMRWGNSSRSSSNHSQTASSQKLPEPSRDQRKLSATPSSAKTRELSILRSAPEQQLCRTAVLCARTVSLWKQLRPNPSRQLESTPGAPGSSQRPPEAPRDAMKYLNLKNNRAVASPAPPPVNEYLMLKKFLTTEPLQNLQKHSLCCLNESICV